MDLRRTQDENSDLKTMTEEDVAQIRNSSTNALKMVYYVIIGLAITQALNRTFLENGGFLGWKVLDSEHLLTTLLLFAFLPTICRFLHGASVHLAALSHKGIKPLVDFIVFGFQASTFYLMAITLDVPQVFMKLFVFMLIGDLVWLFVLLALNYVDWNRTQKQWIMSDIFLIVALIVLLVLYNINKMVLSVSVVLVVTLLATIIDYLINRDFYFPQARGVVSDKLTRESVV